MYRRFWIELIGRRRIVETADRITANKNIGWLYAQLEEISLVQDFQVVVESILDSIESRVSPSFSFFCSLLSSFLVLSYWR